MFTGLRDQLVFDMAAATGDDVMTLLGFQARAKHLTLAMEDVKRILAQVKKDEPQRRA